MYIHVYTAMEEKHIFLLVLFCISLYDLVKGKQKKRVGRKSVFVLLS